MASFFGRPSEINRFLGQVDQDDATNLPIGLAALCRNTEFSLTSARTRSGINAIIQGVNKAPITGIVGAAYTPESDAAGDVYFQLPIFFDNQGALQAETNVGSNVGVPIVSALVTPPANSHMIGVQAYNNVYMSFSDLLQPTGRPAVYNLKQQTLDPYGLKPFGWRWQANTDVIVGEIATPSTIGGNGHTYRCTQSGITGANEPVWPTTEGGVVNDGTAKWKELTPVVANRIPAPAAPTIARDPGAGAFAANKDVYIITTWVNGVGETVASVSSFVTTVLNDAITVTIPALNSLAGWLQTLGAPYAITGAKIYIAQVNHGAAAPAVSSYNLAAGGAVALNSNTIIPALPGATSQPPQSTTARVTPGQLPIPTVAPPVTRVSGGGTLAANLDVYFIKTYANAQGETTPGPASSIINTVLNDAIEVDIEGLDDYQYTAVRIYMAAVPSGSPAPDPSAFAYVGSFLPSGPNPTIQTVYNGQPPPTANTTGAAGNIQADSATGGANGTQGYRYWSVIFMNRNYTWSGFTKSAVFQYEVDEDGWELAAFNIPIGPSNIAARAVVFSEADGTSAGPFFWLGDVAQLGTSQVWAYPQTQVSAGITMVPTLIYDNVTTSATFNFTDAYLVAGNDVTDNLYYIQPNKCVDIYYSKAVDRVFQCGVPGWYSTTWVSLAANPETYRGDASFVTVGNDDGQRAWCVREFKETVFLLRERSGYVLTPNPTNPALWSAAERWTKVGPCGPRAVDVCSECMVFAHRSGLYRYDAQGEPELITKEMPKAWKTINWAAAQTICVTIDHERHVVSVLVPVGASTAPNQEITISYLEGWNNPIHFSTYASKEISMDAARRYSINDIAAFVCCRIERTIPIGAPAFINGPANNPQTYGEQDAPLLTAEYFTSQFVYGSSAPDGTVQAITPGVFNDNGAGIDWQYETVCPQNMMALTKLEGFNLNALGNGPLQISFLAGREMVTDWQTGKKSKELKVRPVDLAPNQSVGISRNTPSKINERWRLRFTNGKQPNVWAELKYACMFGIPMYSGRDASEG